jgi:WD40 repeat protein
VSYARFYGCNELVTASVDATVRRWRLKPHPAADDGIVSAFAKLQGHRNSKNFVGLSVHSAAQQVSGAGGALIACGSEDGVVHVFCGSTAEVLATWRLDAARDGTDAAECLLVSPPRQQEFISSVCWQPVQAAAGQGAAPLLAVASSDGDLRVLKLQ